MKVLNCVFIAFIIGLTSCHAPDRFHDQAGIDKEKYADAILNKVANQLKQETELRPIGNMGQMLYDVERLGLSFYYYKPVDIAEGRKLLVEAINKTLSEINYNEDIRPYLCRYPFLPRNIQIEIFLRTSEGRDLPSDALCVLDAKGGLLRFDIHHAQKNKFITLYKETYEQALERIADPSLPLVPFEPDEEISQEELARLRNGIRFLSNDGSIWHLNEKGFWVSASK
jgi:hypothetical protein